MATLRDIRRRISSVKSTQQITKAMKMVAAAKLRKAQGRLLSARPFAIRSNELIHHIVTKEEKATHPLFENRDVSSVTFLVITGDRGLCGAFNSNVLKRAKAEIDGLADVQKTLVAIGRKSFEFFRKRQYNVTESYVGIFDTLDFENAREISTLLQRKFLNSETDRVVAVYNSFKSAGSQEVMVEQLLPVVADSGEMSTGIRADYIYEPDAETLLNQIVPRNVDTQVWRLLLESSAAEQGARMIAMDSATDNAQEMIYNLTLYYNKVRQAAITKEISEIVGGAEALRG